ncbi:methylthioribose-binding protein [Paenibacillus sp. J31TS4]|nr:methylthioribose-binding protein [Paenibacillus sp. J31TS4]
MKRNVRWTAWLAIVLVLALGLAGCGGGKEASTGISPSASGEAGASGSTSNPLSGKKIALVMRFNTGTFSAQYIEGVKEQVEKLGGKVTVLASDNDLARMASNLDAAINQKPDGILIDHGDAGALAAGVQRAVGQNIPVVAFDSDIPVAGVVNLQQDDAKLTAVTLDKLAADAGGKGTIVKIWVAGFPPMERRQAAYKEFMAKNPGIKEIAAFGNANNPMLDAQSQMEAILKKYPNKGDITAVWAAWDEFAKGAAQAIKQAGRTEIKVYGIDMSDEDLQLIQDKSGPWVASAAVDPKDIGRVQVRYLYQKLHGDQAPDKVVLPPVLVDRASLPEQKISTAELSKHVKGWGSSEQGYTDWLKAAEKK